MDRWCEPLAPRMRQRVEMTVRGAEMCRIPLNPALNAVYLATHTKKGEAACCCAK
jgi:hypothetical protein